MSAPTKDQSSPVTFISTSTGNSFIDPLLLGSKWGGTVGAGATIYYSFPTSSSTAYWSTSSINYGPIYSGSEPFSGFRPLSSTQQSAATNALQAWANVADISLIKVTETISQVGDVRIAATSGGDMDPFTYAYAFGPHPTAIGGDVWLNPNPPPGGNNFSLGGAGFQTLIHELGHALGLDHPFQESSGDTTYLSSQYDNYQYTIMSYSDAVDHPDYGNESFYPTTPMLLDIQAIQYLYGANMTYHTGNNTYVFNGTSTYYQTIWDAGGIDTIQYNSTKGGVIDLNAGHFSTLGNIIYLSTEFLNSPRGADGIQAQNVAIAYNVTIENAKGGSGNDWLIGNAVDNVLDGGLGADLMQGGAGNDTYILDNVNDVFDEAGNVDNNDMVKYAVNASTTFTSVLTLGSSNVETVHLNATTVASLDLTQIESLIITGTGLYSLIGNEANNILTGNGSANNIVGNAGNDTLNGGAGIDTLNGGNGDDTYFVDSVAEANLIQDSSGIDTLNIGFTYALTNPLLENLTLTGTGTINGTGNASDNKIIGNTGANILDGGAGADILDGGKGNDTYLVDNAGDTVIETLTIAQGGGVDLVKSSVSYTLGAYVDNLTLTDGTATGGTAAINGTGNDLNNALIGNAGDNLLSGGWGNDKLTGNAGNDTLDGGAGVDSLVGGIGDDTYFVDLVQTGATAATYKFALQDMVTEAANAGNDTLVLRGSSFNDPLSATTLTLASTLENLDASLTGTIKLNLTGNNLNNTLIGNDANNILNGGIGNDTLVGGAGNDSLIGGTGADIVVAGQGLDTLTGGDGNDIFYFDTIPQAGNEDLIVDFASFSLNTSNYDEIWLLSDIFSSLSAGSYLNGSNFVSASTAQDVDDFIIYDAELGKLYYDVDGSGSTGQVLIATFANHAPLIADDIYVLQA